MATSVLNSPQAAEESIFIARALVILHRFPKGRRGLHADKHWHIDANRRIDRSAAWLKR